MPGLIGQHRERKQQPSGWQTAKPSGGSAPDGGGLLGLQRTAGNAAVTSLLDPGRGPASAPPEVEYSVAESQQTPGDTVYSEVGSESSESTTTEDTVYSGVYSEVASEPSESAATPDFYSAEDEGAPPGNAEAAPPKEQIKYGKLRQVGSNYTGENVESLEFVLAVFTGELAAYLVREGHVNGTIAEVKAMLNEHRLPEAAVAVANDPAVVKEVLVKRMGWAPEDVPRVMTAKTTYLASDDERAPYEVTGSGTLMQNGAPFDTTAPTPMYSKFSGSGWGIFVMSPQGRIYAGSHKVGLFHHSSFLSASDVAGAGELRVEGGKLKGLTTKSGHYLPNAEHMVQILRELKGRSVSLSGVTLTLLGQGGPPIPDAATWFAANEHLAPEEVEAAEEHTYAETYEPADDGQPTGAPPPAPADDDYNTYDRYN
ncbi:MAG TPA: hypothetical protein VK906_04205 [Egicoccus sp.]|nr:hypothetical protein [Egicoccus sp.]HSK22351.1 hypothetical protein [Egicoccus sp.]